MKANEPHFADPDVEQTIDHADSTEKLKSAYLCERTKLEILEVELNRDKVMMIDEHGKMKKISFVSEH